MSATRAVAAALVLALSAGCSGSTAEDKLGAGTITIRLATIDDVNDNGQSYGPQAFVDALAEVSGGRLDVVVDLETFARGEPDDEADLVRALANGDVDAAWPSARAFSRAGIPGLELVEAPLTLTSYEALRELVLAPVADELLERLEGTGIEGLSMAVGPLRRPFGVSSPLLEPEDWSGQRIRSYNSPVQESAIEALGAEPVQAGFGWVALARAGDLDGLEFDMAQYWSNGMTTEAGQIATNVVLWPKVFVLSASKQFLDRLSDEQRGWVREAAELARGASVEGSYDEDPFATKLCSLGAEFYTATPGQLDRMRTAVQPVIEDLSEDPLWSDLKAIADRHPDPDAVNAPEGCAARVAVVSGDPGPAPDTRAELPDGRYRVQHTEEDLAAAGIDAGKAEGQAGTYTLTISKGDFELDCTPVSPPGGQDCFYAQGLPAGFDYNPREVGTVSGTGEVLYFVHDPVREGELTDCVIDPSRTSADTCAGEIRTRVSWTLEGDELRFGDQVSTEPWWSMGIKPWTRIE